MHAFPIRILAEGPAEDEQAQASLVHQLQAGREGLPHVSLSSAHPGEVRGIAFASGEVGRAHDLVVAHVDEAIARAGGSERWRRAEPPEPLDGVVGW